MSVLLLIVCLSLGSSLAFMGIFAYLEFKGWLRERRGWDKGAAEGSWTHTQIWKFNHKTGRYETHDS